MFQVIKLVFPKKIATISNRFEVTYKHDAGFFIADNILLVYSDAVDPFSETKLTTISRNHLENLKICIQYL